MGIKNKSALQITVIKILEIPGVSPLGVTYFRYFVVIIIIKHFAFGKIGYREL